MDDAYPWEDNAQIADLGVLTLTPFRGKGHARKVVRSISKYARDQGYEPQYRCQLDNLASTALAKAAGLTLFGKWECGFFRLHCLRAQIKNLLYLSDN